MDFIDEKLRRIAFHEAGHAWVMLKEGLGVKSLSTRAPSPHGGDNRGETIPDLAMQEGRKDLAEKFARAALAGSAAEHYLMGKWDDESLQANAYDIGRAKGFITMSGEDWKPEALEYYIRVLSNSLLDEISRPRVWNTITGLAYELMKAGTLSGKEVEAILEEGPRI